MSAAFALQLSALILSVSLMIQAAELLAVDRAYLGPLAIWRERTLRTELFELAPPLRHALGWALPGPAFRQIQIARIALALVFPFILLAFGSGPAPAAAIGLQLFLTTLTLARFRGTYNGGSDFMTLVVLCAQFLATLSDRPRWIAGCLGYIAIQVCASYFVAGWIKILKPNWRSGRALRGFLSASLFEPGPPARLLLSNPQLAWAASWAVMLWELAFPAALFEPRASSLFLALGALFHLGNALFFGLNRFWLAWFAAYPAVVFISQMK